MSHSITLSRIFSSKLLKGVELKNFTIEDQVFMEFEQKITLP